MKEISYKDLQMFLKGKGRKNKKGNNSLNKSGG